MIAVLSRWWIGVALAAGLPVGAGAQAQDLLIRHATVHTAGARGTLHDADILVVGGTIKAVGSNLPAPTGATVVEAAGRPVTPALFAGVGQLGVNEVNLEAATVDQSLDLPETDGLHPEFEVCDSFDPDSIPIPVARVEGMGFAWIVPVAGQGFLAGQGCMMRLAGEPGAVGQPSLVLDFTASAAASLGESRSASWMLLRQVLAEARGTSPADAAQSRLTPAGRKVLDRYLRGNGRVLVRVDRAADIVRVVEWAQAEKITVAILGGAEAWKTGELLARARIPVIVDPFLNLPRNFEQLSATLENAARLHRAGVDVALSHAGRPQYARKNRQGAGIAVAHGLPWETALAALTRIPAEIAGAGDRIGTIEPGKRADLVLWEGDPLDVASLPEKMWFSGREAPLVSRQTELRDRYLGTRALP